MLSKYENIRNAFTYVKAFSLWSYDMLVLMGVHQSMLSSQCISLNSENWSKVNHNKFNQTCFINKTEHAVHSYAAGRGWDYFNSRNAEQC